MECVFCKIIEGALPSSVVCETADAIAIMDIQPIAQGHVLVMPKQHFATLREVPQALAHSLFDLALQIEKSLWETEGIACEGTNILQNNGRSAWQDVHHVHFHVIPRFAGDNFRIKYQPGKPTRAELDAVAGRIGEQLLSKRGVSALPQEDSKLLLRIQEQAPLQLLERAAILHEKRRNGILSEKEQEELHLITETIEKQHITRLELLTELAQRRGIPLKTLMTQLGVAPFPTHG